MLNLLKAKKISNLHFMSYSPCLYLKCCHVYEIGTSLTFSISRREGSVRGFGIRTSHSVKGSDSWVDDPITRHIISLNIDKEEQGESHFIWPVILHVKGPFYLLALPLVEPHHLKTYARMCNRSDCGNTIGEDENLSSLLLDLPSITGYGKLFTMLHKSYFC